MPVFYPIQEGRQKKIPAPPVKLGEIPQVRRTYTYFHVGYPFMNEHQLALGESTISQQGKLKTARGKNAILTIEQLQVYALQRTKTARAAIELYKFTNALSQRPGNF